MCMQVYDQANLNIGRDQGHLLENKIIMNSKGKFQITKVKTMLALHHTDVINNHPQYQLHSGIVIGLVGNETLSVPRQRKAIKLSADSMKYKFAEYIDELITLNESKEMIPPEGV